MKKYVIRDLSYELIKNYKDAFDLNEVTLKCTDYFDDYDYIVGDWAYDKLRLKGFCDKNNKLFRKINDISMLEQYIQNDCAYDCKYFVLKKLKSVEKES